MAEAHFVEMPPARIELAHAVSSTIVGITNGSSDCTATQTRVSSGAASIFVTVTGQEEKLAPGENQSPSDRSFYSSSGKLVANGRSIKSSYSGDYT